MPDNDYEDILDQTVDEAKKSLKEIDTEEYPEILEVERNGKERKTLIKWLEERMEVEIDEMKEEETVEEIEAETEGELLGSFSRHHILSGGLLFGIVVGLIAGFGLSGSAATAEASSAEIESSMNELFSATGNTPDSITVENQNGMFYVTTNISTQTENGTQSNSRSYFVSPDGELLFPEVQSPFMTSPYRISELKQRLQQTQQQSNSTQTTAQRTG